MAEQKARKEWSDRDELAAQFMAALLDGDAARGENPPGERLARNAFALADAFMTVREQQYRN
jgi:hypothetical protein